MKCVQYVEPYFKENLAKKLVTNEEADRLRTFSPLDQFIPLNYCNTAHDAWIRGGGGGELHRSHTPNCLSQLQAPSLFLNHCDLITPLVI